MPGDVLRDNVRALDTLGIFYNYKNKYIFNSSACVGENIIREID